MEQSLFDKVQATQQMFEQGLYSNQEYWNVLFNILMSDEQADFIETYDDVVSPTTV